MNSSKDEFYIGWMPEAPDSFAKKAKKAVIFLSIGVFLLAGIVVLSQRGFATSFFEFGNIVTLEGTLIYEPVPMLRVNNGKNIFGKNDYQNILLVGYGKFGARGILHDLERREDVYMSLENSEVKIKGTLIYRDGKTVLELTEGINSLVQIGNKDELPPKIEDYGYVTLKGEIIDPKCYFGVMKPGHGKPHRSCAVRCISGGIPPAFWIKNENGENEYFVMIDSKGKEINQAVLDYVGEPVSVCGRVEKRDDWFYIFTDLDNGFQRLNLDEIPVNCF